MMKLGLKHILGMSGIGGAMIILMMAFAACSTPKPSFYSLWNIEQGKKGKQLSPQDQRLYDALYSAAINERLMERYDVAYVLLQQALSINPNSPEALYELSMIMTHYGTEEGTVRISDGDSLLKYAALKAPENVDYQEAYGLALAEKEKYEEAIVVFEKLAALKEKEDYLSQLVNLYRAAGQDDKALQTLDRLEQLEGASNNIYFERYRIYISQKDTAKAFASIDDLCEANAGDLYFKALKANLYHEQGMNREALALFKAVLQQDPKQVYARVSLLSFYKTLQEEEAYQQLFDDIVYDPEVDAEVRDNIMRQFYVDALQSKTDTAQVMPVIRKVMALPQENRKLGEMTLGYLSEVNYPRDEMAFVHEQILEAEPDYNMSRLELVFIAVAKNQGEKVHQLCTEGRKYDARQMAYYIYDALALNEMERVNEAIGVLEAGAAAVDSTVDQSIRSQMVALLGDLYHEQGDIEAAYQAYDDAVAYDGNNLLCMNNYAYFLSQEGRDLDKAESMSKRTIEAEPDNATYLDTYAWILFMQENYTQAKIYIDETLKYSEATADNATLFDHAGDIYYRCGEVDLAMGFWKKALKLTSDDALRKILKQKVRRGRI